jgi:hypothetical protein
VNFKRQAVCNGPQVNFERQAVDIGSHVDFEMVVVWQWIVGCQCPISEYSAVLKEINFNNKQRIQ